MKHSEDSIFMKLAKDLIIAIITAILTGTITNHFTESEIIDAITTRFDFVDKEMSYKQALEAIYQERKKDKKEIKDLNKKIKEQENSINEQNSTEAINKIIENATQYWNETNYIQCLTLLNNSKSRSSDINALYEKYSYEYILTILSEADSLISQKKYNEAIKLLEDSKNLACDDKMINDKINEINNKQPIKLSELKITTSRFLEQNQDKPLTDTVGNRYPTGNSFTIYAEGNTNYGYGTFYLGKKYTSLNGIIAVSDESEDRDDIQFEGWIEIGVKNNNDDFNSLWTSPMLSRVTTQIKIPELNIKDSEWFEIRYYNNGEYYNLMEGYHSLSIILSDIMLYTY